MKKKFLPLALAMVICLGLLPMTSLAAERQYGEMGNIFIRETSTSLWLQQSVENKTANPTNDKLTVNSVVQAPTVYKIDGSNYFKIRDIAAMLDGTEKQFAVGYAGGKVTATSGQPYEKTGTELKGAPSTSGSAAPSNDTIVIDGTEASLTVYKIGGSNYFKLRDLGKALDFYVGWEAGRGVYIETDKPYSFDEVSKDPGGSTDNPFYGFPPSGAGGGGGTFDDTSDPILLPPLPTLPSINIVFHVCI